MKIQRPPISHRCTCGKRNILIFPDSEGALTWKCSCGVNQTIPFRKNEINEHHAIDIKLKRAPFEHGCVCGKFDVIVLPQGEGSLKWLCGGEDKDEFGILQPCKKVLHLKFNDKGGELV